MTVVTKNAIAHTDLVRDVRPVTHRIASVLKDTDMIGIMFMLYAVVIAFTPAGYLVGDVLLLLAALQWWWMMTSGVKLSLKLPAFVKNMTDPKNPIPGKGTPGKPEGILYLGTTGSGKTEGLKSMVANALCWGSGYAYTDGKADTDLWASLYAMARRFGRDDDLLILNYMTANSDAGAVSNTMNPFSNGSASYLTNMIVSLMPDAGGDNAMWKERAVALMSALMPALTWKRDKQGLLLDVGVVRDHLELGPIIRMSRDRDLPERIIRGLQGYLQTLPGFVDDAFDDEGNEKPPSPDQPMYDLQVARQQHGYLSMQFTRSLQSLADEYGYIFKAQLADIDVLDVVLNRRIMVVLIPALEKSGDEAANLGKIVAASIKGMMGATLGNTVEGSWETAIESKQTRSSSSFMTVFDEVGYYTAQGMAVMAAQARSLGFSLVFAAQDLPAMEKRVKAEARSILGNCNVKIFGKIEDPTDTKDFLEKHSGTQAVYESNSFNAPTDTVSSLVFTAPFYDKREASLRWASRVSYDHLRMQKEGEAYIFFGWELIQARMFRAVPERVRALRVHRLLPVPPNSTSTLARDKSMQDVTAKLLDAKWSAKQAPTSEPVGELAALTEAVRQNHPKAGDDGLKRGIAALVRFVKTAPSQVEPAAEAETDMAAAPVVARTGSLTAVVAERAPAGLRPGDEMALGNEGLDEPGPMPQSDRPSLFAADAMALMPEPVEAEEVDLSLPEDMQHLAQEGARRLHDGIFGSQSAGDAE